MNSPYLHVIILVYNRPKSLQRLLNSLNVFLEQCKEAVSVTFSLEHEFLEENIQVIENNEWRNTHISIHKNETKLGVDLHYLKCIEFCQEYPMNLVLEDDSFISKGAFSQIRFIIDSRPKAAAYSLHSYPINLNTDLPFYPIRNENSFYLAMKISSRGLMLSNSQASNFTAWIKNYKVEDYELDAPPYLVKFGDEIWETGFTKYLMESQQFVLYPYQSSVTIFGDKGEHYRNTFDRFNAQSNISIARDLRNQITQEVIVYDAWLELSSDYFKKLVPMFATYDFEVDLYDTKKVFNSPFVLTTKRMLNPIFSFAFDLKPIENNVIYLVEGDEIYFGRVSDVIPDNFIQKWGRKIKWRWYYQQRYSFMELLIHLFNRVFSNMKYDIWKHK